MTTSGPIYNASVLASGQTRQAVTVQSYTEHQTNRVSVGVCVRGMFSCLCAYTCTCERGSYMCVKVYVRFD